MLNLIYQLYQTIRPKVAKVAGLIIPPFVQFLTEQERQIDWMNAQRQSAAYQEWAGSDNDIYDKIFADVHPAR